MLPCPTAVFRLVAISFLPTLRNLRTVFKWPIPTSVFVFCSDSPSSYPLIVIRHSRIFILSSDDRWIKTVENLFQYRWATDGDTNIVTDHVNTALDLGANAAVAKSGPKTYTLSTTRPTLVKLFFFSFQLAKGGHRSGKVAQHTCCHGGTWYTSLDEKEMAESLGN